MVISVNIGGVGRPEGTSSGINYLQSVLTLCQILPLMFILQLQSNLYISIASGPGGAMLLKRLCIYGGSKYAIIAIHNLYSAGFCSYQNIPGTCKNCSMNTYLQGVKRRELRLFVI